MLDEQVDALLVKYEGKLSFEGRTAFIAQCVRKGYTSNPEYRDAAVTYFEDRKLEDSAIVLGRNTRSVSVAHAVWQKYSRQVARHDAGEHVLDCERNGLFAAAACAAESLGQRDEMRMYQELNEFLTYGPYPDLDVGLLFEAADAADSERTFSKETGTLRPRDEEGLLQNAQYLRDLGTLLYRIRSMNSELQDLA